QILESGKCFDGFNMIHKLPINLIVFDIDDKN
uniref:Restriction endonuclease n=1 Tax=Strongyloides venezuelensis TaxID=75913 RepID=A0A0K0FX80_STRVS